MLCLAIYCIPTYKTPGICQHRTSYQFRNSYQFRKSLIRFANFYNLLARSNLLTNTRHPSILCDILAFLCIPHTSRPGSASNELLTSFDLLNQIANFYNLLAWSNLLTNTLHPCILCDILAICCIPHTSRPESASIDIFYLFAKLQSTGVQLDRTTFTHSTSTELRLPDM